MSRPLRIEYPGAWYHVMNRGRRSEKLFLLDADRKAFIKVMQEAAELWNFRIAAFCLMSSHYHFLIQTPDGNLSRGMRHINGVYTQRFNRRHNKEGQLFRGRYKAVLVQADSHLLEVLRYIHRNPLKAGLIKSLGDYRWSSHAGYLSRAKKWSWLQKEDLLTMLTTYRTKQKSAYIDFVSQGEPEEIEKFYSLKNLSSILGDNSFKEFIREKFSDLLYQPEIPESKRLAPEVESVISAVSEVYRISKEELFVSRRGVENSPRDLAIYLVRNLCRMTLPNVGQEFGIANYSSVSSVVQRVKLRLETDKHLRKKLERIEKKVYKSQKRT
jgi:REP element-mobilizing transposase RayT